MNKSKQLWTLFKFQTTINPAIWFLPLAFGFPLFLPLINSAVSKSYHPDFFSLFMNQNLFFVGIFGAMIMSPEKMQLAATNVTSAYYGSEFLLTRAIDRFVLYRAKAALLFLLVLLLPAIAIFNSLRDPDLIVNEYSKSVRTECVASMPGSVLLPAESKGQSPSLIAIPRGNVLVAEWQLAVFLVTALLLQLLILILYPLRFAKWIFWTFFFGLIFVPLIYTLRSIGKGITNYERCFFWFAGHPVLFWCVLGTAFVLGQLWCERRFAQLEQ